MPPGPAPRRGDLSRDLCETRSHVSQADKLSSSERTAEQSGVRDTTEEYDSRKTVTPLKREEERKRERLGKGVGNHNDREMRPYKTITQPQNRNAHW